MKEVLKHKCFQSLCNQMLCFLRNPSHAPSICALDSLTDVELEARIMRAKRRSHNFVRFGCKHASIVIQIRYGRGACSSDHWHHSRFSDVENNKFFSFIFTRSFVDKKQKLWNFACDFCGNLSIGIDNHCRFTRFLSSWPMRACARCRFVRPKIHFMFPRCFLSFVVVFSKRTIIQEKRSHNKLNDSSYLWQSAFDRYSTFAEQVCLVRQ